MRALFIIPTCVDIFAFLAGYYKSGQRIFSNLDKLDWVLVRRVWMSDKTQRSLEIVSDTGGWNQV